MDEARLGAIDHCYFCGKPNTKVSKLIAGPGVAICDGCVTEAWFTLIKGYGPSMQIAPGKTGSRCSFCSLERTPQATRKGARICSDCIELCKRIIGQGSPPKTEPTSGERTCSFCARPQEAASKLVAGPGVHICNFCVIDAVAVVEQGATTNHVSAEALEDETDDDEACSFCGKPVAEVASVAYGPRVRICDECLDLCVEITAEEPV